MTIAELEALLRAARFREEKAIKALALKHKGGELEESLAAGEEVLSCERALSAAKGEEYAAPIDFPVQWDTGAPLPYLLQNDYRTFLIFFLRDEDPNWDGSYVTMRAPSDPAGPRIALVEFKHCVCTKMGTPNDEVLEGHPLSGKGLRGYAALKVENSRWIRELEAINAVHAQHRPATWRSLNHYILGFHDSMFECVAEGFSVETYEVSLSELLAKVCGRLVE